MSHQPAAAAGAAPSAPAPAAPPEAPIQPELVPGDDPEDDVDDGDSALGSDAESSTASVTSSILEYRTIRGRTYHSDRHPTEYFTPNDEQQLESIEITHHYLTVLLDDKLFLAPIKEKPEKVLDIGTGTGIWAIDFADQYPETEVTGSDLSPIQPQWVPPNVRFEIDDASLDWTWKDNTFDFVHIRYLFGAIKDWTPVFREAYRCTKPGGWVQSGEADVEYRSDDATTDLEPILQTWKQLFKEGGASMGRPFFLRDDRLIERAMEEAGFVDIKTVDYKFPVGPWAKDPKLREVGQYVKLTLENDLEGYTSLLWHNILQWPPEEYHIFMMAMRKFLRNRKVHSYMITRYVYGRKPE